MAGQVPLTVGAEKEFPIHAFLPDRKTAREMLLEVGEIESIKLEPTLTLPDEEKPETTEAPEAAPKEGETPKTETAPSPDADGSAQPEAGAEQPKADQPATGQPVEDGITETRSTKEQLEALTPADPNAVRATHLITDSGMEFWLNDRNQIIKVEIPDQGLELILEKVETAKLD
jgi:hypothetical protein